MMRSVLWLLVASALPALALAHGGVDAAKRSVEASMLVTGEIAVNPDGSVYGYSLDHRDKLPAVVIKLIGQTLPAWKFTPVNVDGKPELAKALMSLRIVARQIDAKHDAISVESAAFGVETAQSNTTSACADHSCLTYAKRDAPGYPPNLVNDLVSGTVYLVLQVDRQGGVAKAAVEQVDLRQIADVTTLNHWRRELGSASIAAAQHWTFSVPQTGPEARETHWFVRVPVNFTINVLGQMVGMPKYGQWDAYVPGPVNSIPWVTEQPGQVATRGDADAIPDNGVPFVPDAHFALLTPLDGSGVAKPLPEGKPGQG